MYAPNVYGILIAVGTVLAVPILLGAVIIILGGSEGAAGTDLPRGRRLLATRLNRYRCSVCGTRFRSRYGATRYPRCEEAGERDEAERVLAGLRERYESLPKAGRSLSPGP